MQIWSGNKNMEAYHKMEPELLTKYYGKIAVFYDGKLASIGDNIEEAVKKANVSRGKVIFVRELFSFKEQTEAIL